MGGVFTQTLGLNAVAGASAYVNSGTPYTVTIAASATSGTATVTSPVGTYFVSGWSYTTTDATTDASSMPRVTFSGTTITATRGTASVATITCIVWMVDATSSLITSVQFGTTALTSGQNSNTSTISAVTSNNTAVLWLGQSTAGSQSYSGNSCIVSLSGTTVTVQKQFAGSVETVAWCIVEFNGSALQQAVQRVAVSASRVVNTWTQTVTSVTMANSMMFYGGQYANVTSNQATNYSRAQLTAATTVTFNVNTTNSVVNAYNFSLVEFVPAVMNTNAVQRGTITLTATTSNTGTVSSISTTKAVMTWLGNTTTTTTANAATGRHKITQTNATTLTETVNTSGTGTGSYEIGNFN